MGTLGTEIIKPDKILEEDSQVSTEKVYVRSYVDAKITDYTPERPVDENSNVLKFDIPSYPWYVWRPQEVKLLLRCKITKQDGTRHRTPAHIAGNTLNQPSVRFKNTTFLGDIIEKVEVMPNMGADIEQMNPAVQMLQEKFNNIYLTSKLEREAPVNWLNHSFSASLHRGEFSNRVGITHNANTDTQDEKNIRLMEIQAGEFRTYVVKIPGSFFSIGSEIPGGLIFRIKLTLSPAAKIIYARYSHLTGEGLPLDGPNVDDDPAVPNDMPKLQIDPENCKLRVYYRKSYNYKEEEDEFFAGGNYKMECVQDWRVATGLNFEQRQRAAPTKENKFVGVENQFSEKCILGFLEASELENGSHLLENACYRSFGIKEWNLKINGYWIFEEPIKWQPSDAVRRYLWDSQLDAIAHPEDVEARKYGASVDNEDDLENGRWFVYLNLTTEQRNLIDKVGVNFAGPIELYTTFMDGVQPDANHPDIVFVMVFPDRKKFHLINPSTNEWSKKDSYAESLETPDKKIDNYRSKGERDYL